MIASARPIWSADFCREVARDGLGRGVGDHRGVSVHWDFFFLLSLQRSSGRRPALFCHGVCFITLLSALVTYI